jgi:class 3 adenylate cyclase/streptogramin lyase
LDEVNEKDAPASSPDVGIRTFLIADVRGYTLFTQERGDEAAAKLAAKFATMARDGVEARGGEVIELRGDEALAVFTSPRQAIRAALDLQARFVEETLADPSVPLPVGIGLDAGEAVPVGGGYRGGALNLAARLCGLAGPGETLASQEVVHLARKVDGVRYVDRGQVRLRGLADPVRAIRVLPEGADPAARLAAFTRPRQPSARRRARPAWLVAGIAALVVAIIVVVTVLAGGGAKLETAGPGPPSVAAGSISRIDPTSGRTLLSAQIGKSAVAIAVGEGSLWVADRVDNVVVRLDPFTGHEQARIRIGGGPTGIGVSGSVPGVWVMTGRAVWRIDPTTNEVNKTIPLDARPTGITVGEGAVWVSLIAGAHGLIRIDPGTGAAQSIDTTSDFRGDIGVAVGDGAVWVIGHPNVFNPAVAKIDASHPEFPKFIVVGHPPSAIAWGDEALWTLASNGAISRIDPKTDQAVVLVDAGSNVGGLAVGDGSVWVTAGHTLVRVDPEARKVIATFNLKAPLTGVVVAGDAVWVTTDTT